MIYARNFIIALLFGGLFASCSLSQTTSSKPTGAWPSPKLIEASGVAVESGKFRSEGGKFVIDIPNMPTQTIDLGSEKGRANGVDAGRQFIWRFDDVLYTVSYTPPLDPDGNPLANKIEDLVSGSKIGLQRQNVKLISEKPFAFGDFQGTELRYASPQRVWFIQRLFVSGEVGYSIVGSYGEGKEEQVLKVLSSFKTLKSVP